MATFDCPVCDTEYDIADYPDHLMDIRNNRFEFECEGCCTFMVDVDWDPLLTPLSDTVVRALGGSND